MAPRFSSLLWRTFHRDRRGLTEDLDVLPPELIPLSYRLSEGDVSSDLMHRYCRASGLRLRSHYSEPDWYDFVGDINIGINLYYLTEAAGLWQRVQRRGQKRYLRHQGSGQLQLTRAGRRWVIVESGRPLLALEENSPVVRRYRGAATAKSVVCFLKEARDPGMSAKVAFARYTGRVLLVWVDCGPAKGDFPPAVKPAGKQRYRRGPVQLACTIAAAADIDLTPQQTRDAWSRQLGTASREASRHA